MLHRKYNLIISDEFGHVCCGQKVRKNALQSPVTQARKESHNHYHKPVF